MAVSIADIRDLKARAEAHKQTLEDFAARKAALEGQRTTISKKLAAILNKLLVLVNDEIRFGNDIVRLCSGWKWDSTEQAWIPDATAKRLRQWYHCFAANVQQLQALTEAEVGCVNSAKSEASALHHEMTKFSMDTIAPMNAKVEQIRRDCQREGDELARRKEQLVGRGLSLQAEMEALQAEQERLRLELRMLPGESDVQDAKGFALAGGGLGIAAMATSAFVPGLGLVLGIGGLFLGGVGNGMISSINRKIKSFNKRCEQFGARREALTSAACSFESDYKAFEERIAELPRLVEEVKSAFSACETTSADASKLDEGCLQLHSAMMVVIARVNSILSSSTTLGLTSAAHDNLVRCAEAVVEAFTEDRAGSDASIKVVITRLTVVVKQMKSNGKVTEVLSKLEARDDYEEIVQQAPQPDSFLSGIGCSTM